MKKMSKKRVTYLIVALIFIIGISLIVFINSKFIEFTDKGKSLMSLEGYKQIEVDINNNNIILKDNCKAIIVAVPPERAYNLNIAKNNITEERPSIYDSTLEIIKSFNIEFIYIKIEKLENNIYYSKAIFSNNDKILNLDMRPSDAMVLALRLNKPIYINEELLNSQAVNIC